MLPLPFRDRSLWSLYSRYYRGHSRVVAFCLGGSLVRSLLSVPIALLVREAIDGGFTKPGAGFDTANPATSKVLATVTQGTEADLNRAVAAARKAQPGWAKASAYLRGQILCEDPRGITGAGPR